MEIAIVSPGLAFGPNTLDHFSLGGSETAALMIAKELRALGHLVTLFCNLPGPGRPDFIQSGSIGPDKVRYVQIEAYGPFAANTEVDLLIVSRDPRLFGVPHQARKAVLWCHDLATYHQYTPMLLQHAFNFDEIWTVSEYHRQQIHKVIGYPLANIRATRNGISRWNIDKVFPRQDKTLLYAARPERGLDNLIKPGGIMDRLPDFKLKVCMYNNYPEHMRGYYEFLFNRMKQMPNVEMLGSLTQKQLRQLMSETWAYVYPTGFEEVSCILAREAIEQHLPFICTHHGALPETLGGDAVFVGPQSDRTYGSSTQLPIEFAAKIRWLHEHPSEYAELQRRLSERQDLYWDDVAKQMASWAEPLQPSAYSKLFSLIEDSDVVAAKAYADSLPPRELTKGVRTLIGRVEQWYPYLFGRETFADYYERYYKNEDAKGARVKPNLENTDRFKSIAEAIAQLPPGSKVVDYGCAEGTIILGLAKHFPDKLFFGHDFAQSNLVLAQKYADQDGLKNVSFHLVTGPKDIAGNDYDAAVVSEVLEHVEKPWKLTEEIESHIKEGGKIIITVPSGPWEAIGLYDINQWGWRAHIWHINKWMIRKMFADKEHCQMANITIGHGVDGRALGHLVYIYQVDHKPIYAIDPLEKAKQHRCRQTVSTAIIAMNSEETILRTLNSIGRYTQQIQIALGPSQDNTQSLIKNWATQHPWVEMRVVQVPKIEPGKFGFDDARNTSAQGLDGDWIFWIDTDEYLSPGAWYSYLRNNAFDSYAIHQHHFTVDPRGTPAQLDKPARLFRNNGSFTFYGKVHEHAEKGFNGGPGFGMIMHNVDIGHVGYVNDAVRRDRFQRNYPFLEWDRQVYPERKLGLYLWLRDTIHKMRWSLEQRDMNFARQLAEEAVQFYKKNSRLFENIGSGYQQALGYVSEAMTILGRGIPFEVMVKMPDTGGVMAYAGIFDDPDELAYPLKQFMRDELNKRTSGYWQ